MYDGDCCRSYGFWSYFIKGGEVGVERVVLLLEIRDWNRRWKGGNWSDDNMIGLMDLK